MSTDSAEKCRIISQKESKDHEEPGGDPASDGDSAIGKEAALAIAFSHAGVPSERDASVLNIEREYNNGSVTYTVEFIFNGYKYEYEIDGFTGEVLDHSKEVRQTVAP